jgi:hypothetical protein
VVEYRLLLVNLSGLALCSCGGGGAQDVKSLPVALTMGGSPSPSPTPTPAPVLAPPAPVPLTFATPSVVERTDGSGATRVSVARDGDGSQVTISDPDAPTATSYDQLKLNGDEEVTVRQADATAGYMQAFTGADAQGLSNRSFYAGSLAARQLPVLGWQAHAGPTSTAQLTALLTETVEKVPGFTHATGTVAAHARLLETMLADRRGLQLIGDRTPLNLIPLAGSSRFVGEVYGTAFPSGAEALPYIGDAVIYVSYGATSEQVHGLIDISQYAGPDNKGIPIVVQISADLVSGALVHGSVAVQGAGGQVEYGSVAGAFYGKADDELGIVLGASGGPGSMIGGMILKRR